MNHEVYRKLWEQAIENARTNYEEEYGGSWEDADKYERADFVFDEYEKLVFAKESKEMTQMRDEKGRFTSTKTTEYGNATNNTTNNVKENDTMMNRKMTNAEERTMKLAQAGVNVDNFFNLNLQIPFGAEVMIKVDGKEMIIPATNGKATGIVNGLANSFGVPTIISSNGDVCDAETGEVLVMANDPIAQSIIENGYVKNSKLFRRWITAQTFKMINYKAWRNPNRTGWEACMKDCYGYEYQFTMLLEEIRVLSILQKEDMEAFAERIHFFNGNVVVATLEDYLYRLGKYVKKQMRENPRTYKGQPYVKLAKYGNVLVKDLDAKVYNVIKFRIDYIKTTVRAGDYHAIYVTLKDFMNECYNKLPYETTKCAVFKDAFKGSGAYYSLLNLIRFHGVVLRGAVGKYDSEACLKDLLNGEYKNDVWKFHQLLIDTIEYNNFDLRRSIAEGNAAPNTTSYATHRYAR